ncbi:MAG TPA: hypothetical protein VKO83_03040 [Steroidobacteraceae bacterium]|nr:hypothetical protein [Steroidobacteraceae bacterium]
MASDDIGKLEPVDTATTARIDRRQTVLAQIEAALLADKLSVIEFAEESTGTDPYNRGRVGASVWDAKRPR